FLYRCELGRCSFHPAARASRSVEISTIRPAIAPSECFTHFRRCTCKRRQGGEKAHDHRRAHRRRVPRSAYFRRGLRAPRGVQWLFAEDSQGSIGHLVLSLPPSPGQFGLWHPLRKRLPQYESPRRGHRRLVSETLPGGRDKNRLPAKMIGTDAVILLSGGLDSATAAAMAKQQ